MDLLDEKVPRNALIKKVGDIGNPQFIKQLVSELDSSQVELLVNNAGVRWPTTVLDASDEEWETTMKVNLTAPFYLTREIGNAWKAAGRGGVIINIASIAGLMGLNNRASYCASKGGLIALTKAAAMDLAPAGIRVIAICPGFVNTSMTVDNAQDYVRDYVPIGKSGKPNDIAQAVVDLMRWEIATGTIIPLDGGLTAGFRW